MKQFPPNNEPLMSYVLRESERIADKILASFDENTKKKEFRDMLNRHIDEMTEEELVKVMNGNRWNRTAEDDTIEALSELEAKIRHEYDEKEFLEIFTDHAGTFSCRNKDCLGSFSFQWNGHISTWDKYAICGRCGQKYKVTLSG